MTEPSPRLIIVCGLPGSGKTIHAKQIEQKLRAIRFSPDEWMEALDINLWETAVRDRIEKLQWRLTQNLLSFGHNVVIEWGSWGRSERDTLRLGARALGATVELHYLDAPIDVLLERVLARNRESPPVTREDILEWSEIFQRPTPEEMALFDSRSC